jgi:hypothetical protein
MNIFRFFLSAVLASASVGHVAAYPTGAGACPEGEAAPGGSHLRDTKNVTTGFLSDGGFSVTFDGTVPSSDNKVTVSKLELDVVVTGDSAETTFKGILIRVGNTTSDQVIPGGNLTVATACEGQVGSATHNTSDDKTSGSATIDLTNSDVAMVKLDISVIVQNSDSLSVSTYYYTGYEVTVKAEDGPTCRDGLFSILCK